MAKTKERVEVDPADVEKDYTPYKFRYIKKDGTTHVGVVPLTVGQTLEARGEGKLLGKADEPNQDAE